jgi:hypothetical protein
VSWFTLCPGIRNETQPVGEKYRNALDLNFNPSIRYLDVCGSRGLMWERSSIRTMKLGLGDSYPIDNCLYETHNRAVAQAVSRCLPTAAARVRVRAGMWGLWWTKQHWGRFSPSTSVSPANHHSTNFSIIIIPGVGTIGLLVPQCRVDPIGLQPPIYEFKKYIRFIRGVWDRYRGYRCLSIDSSSELARVRN